MAIKTSIVDGRGSESEVMVTSRGELVTGAIDYSLSYNADVDTGNTAFNFIGPLSNRQFVITSLHISTDRTVGANGAVIIVYEAAADNTTTVSRTILEVEMLKSTHRDLSGLRMIVTEGRWVNIKSTDTNVNATLMGYYVQA